MLARLLLAASLAVAAPSATAFAQDVAVSGEPGADNLALAREIIENGYPPEIRHSMYDSVMANVMAQMRKATEGDSQDPGIRAIVDRSIEMMRKDMLVAVDRHTPAIFDSFARAYARSFSTADLMVIRDFSRTSAGRAFISRSSQLLGDPDVAAANQAFMRDALISIGPNVDKLRDELIQYYKAHPSAIPKTAKVSN